MPLAGHGERRVHACLEQLILPSDPECSTARLPDPGDLSPLGAPRPGVETDACYNANTFIVKRAADPKGTNLSDQAPCSNGWAMDHVDGFPFIFRSAPRAHRKA